MHISDFTRAHMMRSRRQIYRIGKPASPESIAGLAARLSIDRNNVGLILTELEERGLVERRVDPADQRARRLYLTAKGEKLYQQLRPWNTAANERILAPLSPRQRELLLDLLVRVVKANAIYARPGARRRKRGSRLQRHNNKG